MASTLGAGKLTRAHFASHLEFVQLKELGCYNQCDDSLMQCPIELLDDKTRVRMTLHTYKSDISASDQPVFIFSGRKASAYIPNVGAEDSNIRTILVGTASDLGLLADYLRPGLDFLCIEELSTVSHGHYEQLGLLNSRRISAFLCALYFKEHYNIPYALMGDDNLEALHIRTGDYSWSSGFNALVGELGKANSVCVSLPTVATSGIRRPRDNELGSKLFMYDLERLHGKLGAVFSHGFMPFFPNNGNALWGEDYFFQIMFAVLFAKDHVRGFHVLDSEQYGISRAPLASLCKKVVKTAGSLCDTTPKDLFGGGYEALQDFRLSIDDGLKKLATLIAENMEAYRRQLSVYEDTDLMLAHTQANGVLYRTPSVLPAIDESSFLMQLKQQLKTVMKHGYLHVYQKKILDEVVETLGPQRFMGMFNMATGTGKTYIQIHLAIAALLTGTRQPIVLVSPYMALVEQAFRDCVEVLSRLPNLPIDVCQILKVDSHPSSVSVDALRLNRSLDDKGCILIVCQDSYQKILASDDAAMRPYQNPCMLLVDECHLQEGLLPSYLTSNTSFIGCLSGTPPSTLNDFITIDYSRERAVAEGSLTPCILDSFSTLYSAEMVECIIQTMPSFLNKTRAPGGGRLIDYKGIIYVPNNKKSSNYSKELKNVLDKAGITSFEINSDEPNSRENVQAYKHYQASTHSAKILICKGMLREGFSDNETSWVIYLQRGSAANFAQAAGRAMRLSSLQKIAYVIAFNDVNAELVFKESQGTADEKALARADHAYKAWRETTNGEIAVIAEQPHLYRAEADVPLSKRMAGEESEIEEECTSSERSMVEVVKKPALKTRLKRRQGTEGPDGLPERKVSSYCSFFKYPSEKDPLETLPARIEALEECASNTVENDARFPFGTLHILLDELYKLPASTIDPDVIDRLFNNVLYELLEVNPDINELIIKAELRLGVRMSGVGESGHQVTS